MKINLNFGIKGKLILLVTASVLVLGAIAFYATRVVGTLSSTIDFLGNQRIPITSELGDIRAASNGAPRFLWLALAQNPGSEERKKSLQKVGDFKKMIRESISTLHGFNLVDQAQERLKEAEALFIPLDQVIEEGVKDLSDGSPQMNQKARELLLTKMPPLAVELTKNIQALAKIIEEKNKSVVAESIESSQKSNRRLILAALLVGIIFCVIGYLFASYIARTLSEISTILNQTSLQVAAAATQIAEASQALAQANTEQAAAVQETSASTEETKAMVGKNAQNAKSASEVSTESKSKAIKGQEVVNQMITSMGEIDKSNEKIGEQVAHSNREFAQMIKVIQDISLKTKVINDIVFQTKLLSFNASVEAARAGEHGKGFAVVAEEVGNLAQMSGNAAKEISTLLEDSTRKVESIVAESTKKVEVLLSEGKKKVEFGSSTAKQCGTVLDDIVSNVASVAQMAGEISSASGEQLQGVAEIAKAMNQLEQVTHQNAATSQEAAASAEQLSTQAKHLQEAVKELLKLTFGKESAASTLQDRVSKMAYGANVIQLKPKKETDFLPDKQKQLAVSGGNPLPLRDHAGFEES